MLAPEDVLTTIPRRSPKAFITILGCAKLTFFRRILCFSFLRACLYASLAGLTNPPREFSVFPKNETNLFSRIKLNREVLLDLDPMPIEWSDPGLIPDCACAAELMLLPAEFGGCS